MQAIKKSISTRNVLISMILIQLLWILLIWLTGASTNQTKILTLALLSLVGGLVILFLPETTIASIEKFRKERLFQNEKLFLLVMSAVFLTVGFLFASQQRLWTWDEEQNLAASSMIAQEGLGEFFERYSEFPWLGRQHPPLVPIMNGLFMRFIGVSLLNMRFISIAFGVGLLVITYYLGRELFDREVGQLASISLASFPLIWRLGSAALTDIQVAFFFALGLLLSLRLMRNQSYLTAITAGIVIGAGLLTKYMMVFIFPVMFCFFIVNRSFRKPFLQLCVMGLVAGGILSSWLYYAYQAGLLQAQSRMVTQLDPSFFVSTEMGLKIMINSIATRLTSAIGVHNLPLLVLGLTAVLRRRSTSDWMALLWILSVSLILLFSLPDHRYFMPTFPAMAIIIGKWLKSNPAKIDRILLLTLLYLGGALYLFVDWSRVAQLWDD